MTDTFDQSDLIDEACERAGLDPSTISHRHLNSFRRSILLLNTELENEPGKPEYREDTVQLPLPNGYGAYPLPPDTIDVLTCSIAYPNGTLTPLGRSSREDHMSLSRPVNTKGLPNIFWVAKSLPADLQVVQAANSGWGAGSWGGVSFGGGANPSAVNSVNKWIVLWPNNGGGDAVLTISRLREIAMPAGMGGAVDMRRNWWDTYAQGLAARMAEKYNPEIAIDLRGKFEAMLKKRNQDENRGPIITGFRGHGFSRGRRH